MEFLLVREGINGCLSSRRPASGRGELEVRSLKCGAAFNFFPRLGEEETKEF